MKTIILELKESYGRHRIYPVCKTARLLSELLERKTFLPRDLELLKQLGFSAEVRPGGAKRRGLNDSELLGSDTVKDLGLNLDKQGVK